MSALDDKIEKLQEQLKQAKARKQQLEAKQRAAQAKKQRQDDTRRKILLGAFYLDAMQNNAELKGGIIQKMDGYLKRNDDRALFGLPPLQQHEDMK